MKRLILVVVLAVGCSGSGTGKMSTTVAGMDAGAAPAIVDTPYSLSTGPFSVPAGVEMTKCLYTRAPMDQDMAVFRFEAHMRPGSHHFNMMYITAETGEQPQEGLHDCGDYITLYLAGSQWDDFDHSLPAGKALKVPKGAWFVLESHFVNATTSEGTGGVDVTLHTQDPSTVGTWAGVYFNLMNMDQMMVPPQSSATLWSRCSVHADTTVFLLTSHMHHFGTEFDINLYDEDSGAVKPLYQSMDWSHPLVDDITDTPLVLGSDQDFEWKCHYTNDRDTTLYGGLSAENNEMCDMAAYYYPAVETGLPYCFAPPTTATDP